MLMLCSNQTSGGVVSVSLFPSSSSVFFCFTDFSASAKKETDFYAALKLMFEFLLCYCLAQGR